MAVVRLGRDLGPPPRPPADCLACCDGMDTGQFWALIDDARRQAPDPADGEAVAARAVLLLSARPREEIVVADQVLWSLMAVSYRNQLWTAAYLVNGGCSDDGFEYFRGWLIAQGHEVFEQVVADPDALAGLPAVRAAAPGNACLECEDMLYIPQMAYRAVTGTELPADTVTMRYPELNHDRDDFEDRLEMERRFPRLSALFPS